MVAALWHEAPPAAAANHDEGDLMLELEALAQEGQAPEVANQGHPDTPERAWLKLLIHVWGRLRKYTLVGWGTGLARVARPLT